MKRIITIMMLPALLLCTGCADSGSIYSNYREVEQMQLIRTLGFDRKKEQIRLSISGGSSSSGSSSQSTEGGSGSASIIRMTANGDSITDAIEQLQDYTNWEELYYAHAQYFLVGEDCARNTLSVVLAYNQDSRQLRSDMPLFVVKGDTAENLVLHCGGKDSDITEALDSIVRDSEKRGDGHAFTCGDIVAALAEYGAALAPALEVRSSKEVNESADEKQVSPLPAGYAILKEDRLVGFIHPEHSRGVNLLIGESGTGTVTLDAKESGTVALTFTKGKVDLYPIWSDSGELTGIRAKIKVTAYVEEADDPKKLDRQVITDQFSSMLEGWVGKVLQQMSDTGADFLGIGHQLRRKEPQKWDSMPTAWEEAISQLSFDILSDCEILRLEELKD